MHDQGSVHGPSIAYGAAALATALTACGGGGSGASSGGGGITPVVSPSASASASSSPTAKPSPSPTTSPTSSPGAATVSGTVFGCNSSYEDGVSCAPGTGLAGGTVTLGKVNSACGPDTNAGGASACGSPGMPVLTATTSSTGAFSIANVAAGTYFLQVAASGYATLHRTVSVSSGSLGSFDLTALSSDETAWIAQTNADRVSYGATGDLVADEYLTETTRSYATWTAQQLAASGVANEDTGDGIYGPEYLAKSGALYGPAFNHGGGAAGVTTWNQIETAFMGEEANCPQPYGFASCYATYTGNPPNNVGHFLGIENPDDVWVGVGEESSGGQTGFIQGFATTGYFTYNGSSIASKSRTTGAAVIRR